jgi:uncharacterized protein (DUF169 family)
VAIKYSLFKPEGTEQLDKNIAFCEMAKEVQNRAPFYVTKDNFICGGPYELGMADDPPLVRAGEMGVPYEIYEEARAERKLNEMRPRLASNTVNYATFSTLDKLSFEPDVLIFIATVAQAEILFRARNYRSAEPLSSKITPICACGWLYVYPYITGELNYVVTGLSFGMKSYRVFPDGLMLVAIPYQLLPTVIQNLQDMQWVPWTFTVDREEVLKRSGRIMGEMSQRL